MDKKSSTLPILKMQRFSTHDGPGIRTTVFIKGCPLKCLWCHNPESQSRKPNLFYTPSLCIGCGRCVTACPQKAHGFENGTHNFKRELCLRCLECINVCPSGALELDYAETDMQKIVEEIKKDQVFYGKKGGVTLSGGEPLLYTEKALTLLKLCKDEGICTAVETSGYFGGKYVPALVETVDLFLWDVKDCVATRHERNTGVSNQKIFENLFKVDELGGKTILKCILLNGVNTDENHLNGVAELYSRLKHCLGVEIFSYHHYGVGKYEAIGKEYYGKKEWIVSKMELKNYQKYLKERGVKCKISE